MAGLADLAEYWAVESQVVKALAAGDGLVEQQLRL